MSDETILGKFGIGHKLGLLAYWLIVDFLPIFYCINTQINYAQLRLSHKLVLLSFPRNTPPDPLLLEGELQWIPVCTGMTILNIFRIMSQPQSGQKSNNLIFYLKKIFLLSFTNFSAIPLAYSIEV